MLRVAVICEFSGRVRDAFLARGHFAMSFDLLPSDSDQGPHYHGDIQNVQMDHWRHYDMAIAFPPCTDLAVSGARWDNQTPSGQNKLGPSPDRWKIRSTTYQGIADAMAEQWGNIVETADLFERR